MSGKHRLQKEERIVPLGALAAGGVLSFMLGAVIVSAPPPPPPTPISTVAAPTITPTLLVPTPAPTTAPTTTPTTTTPRVTTAATTARTETEPSVVEETYTPEYAASTSGLVDAARTYLNDGIPYVYGGKDESGMDCSAFIWHVLRDQGYDVPYRNSAALKTWTDPVSADEARPGDLVFWPGHVGLYSGDGDLIDMSSGTGTVAERALWGTPTFGRIP